MLSIKQLIKLIKVSTANQSGIISSPVKHPKLLNVSLRCNLNLTIQKNI